MLLKKTNTDMLAAGKAPIPMLELFWQHFAIYHLPILVPTYKDCSVQRLFFFP